MLPPVADVLKRVRHRAGLEKARRDLQQRLSEAPDRSPEAQRLADDLLAVSGALSEIEEAS
jgi:hypothetical protein